MSFDLRFSTLPKQRRQHKKTVPPVLVMTDDEHLPDPVAVASLIPREWGLLFRHYEAADRDTLALHTAEICRARKITFLVADDWRLAARVGADGVHIPESLSARQPMAPLLQWRRNGKLVTLSAHGTQGIRRAKQIGADAVLVSPVAPTRSHPDAKPLGVLRFSALARSTPAPLFALGGIALKQRERLTALGAAGIAGISLFEDAVQNRS